MGASFTDVLIGLGLCWLGLIAIVCRPLGKTPPHTWDTPDDADNNPQQ